MRFRSMSPMPAAALASGALALFLLLGAAPAAAQADKVAHGLALQAARAKFVVVKAKKVFYTRRWDLSGLPVYRPQQQVSGTIRMWGSNYIEDSNLGKYWEEGFRKYQPGAHIAFHMKTATAAVPALVFGVADIGVGRSSSTASSARSAPEAGRERAGIPSGREDRRRTFAPGDSSDWRGPGPSSPSTLMGSTSDTTRRPRCRTTS